MSYAATVNPSPMASTSAQGGPHGSASGWGTMLKPEQKLPTMPEIGYPESFYARQVHKCDKAGDIHARESYKVGQYVTLALDTNLKWQDKLRYFQHALRRHCNPPPIPDEQVWLFYRQLAHLVRDYCGREALRLASAEDDYYARRTAMGGSKDRIETDAETFFGDLMGHTDHCPDHFHEEDWAQLKLLRDQWI